MARTYTLAEALKVHGRITRTSGTALADQWLQAKGFGSVGEARRAAGHGVVTEANLNAAVTRAVAGAMAAKKARKAARTAREAEESLIRRKITEALAARGITETLTAGGVPQLPGAGMAPGQDSGEAGLYATMSAGRESPFWHLPATADGSAHEAPEPPKPLHDMTPDEFHSYAGQASSAYARAAGFGGPVWQG